MKVLETKDLILKPYEEKYVLDAYKNIFCQEETARFVLWKPADSVIEVQVKLERWSQNWDLFFLIIEKCSNKCIGYLGVDEIEPKVYGRLGIGIGKEFKNKGYGTQALKELINYLKSKNAKELQYSHFKENIASQKLALKMGFKKIREDKRIRAWDNKEFDEYFYELKLENELWKI